MQEYQVGSTGARVQSTLLTWSKRGFPQLFNLLLPSHTSPIYTSHTLMLIHINTCYTRHQTYILTDIHTCHMCTNAQTTHIYHGHHIYANLPHMHIISCTSHIPYATPYIYTPHIYTHATMHASHKYIPTPIYAYACNICTHIHYKPHTP